MSAYGLDSDTTNTVTLTQILESDPNDPRSFANQSHNAAYIALAQAFKFDSKGNAKTANVAQTNQNMGSTVQAYMIANGGVPAKGAAPTFQQTMATTESQYYATTINGIKTVDDFLKDPRLVKYAVSAFGLGKAGLSTAGLRKILTSDPRDPASYINRPENAKYRPLAVAFNFGPDGKTLNVPINQVQDRSQIVGTSDGHVEQTMETEAAIRALALSLRSISSRRRRASRRRSRSWPTKPCCSSARRRSGYRRICQTPISIRRRR